VAAEGESMSQLMVTAEPQATDKAAAAVRAIHRQLCALKRAAAGNERIDNELFLTMAIIINHAHDIVDEGRLRDAYHLVRGVELAAAHAREQELQRAAHAVSKMILWTITHVGGSDR